MDKTILFKFFLAILVCGVVASIPVSCGGGGGGSQVTVGKITGFGSVYVNNVEYNTSDSSFHADDDDAAGESDLHEGMQVTVVHDGEGHASHIYYEEELTGPVSGLVESGSSKSFTVLGVNVVISSDPTVTYFDDDHPGYDFQAVQDGDVLELSGTYDSNGTLQASYVDYEGSYSANQSFEVKGSVIAHDSVAQTITVGLNNSGTASVTASYDSASIHFDDIPAGGVSVGLYVEMKGMVNSLDPLDLTVYEIEAEHDEGHDSEHDDGGIDDSPDHSSPGS